MSVEYNDRGALRQEVDVMKNISHANIVKFIDVCESEGSFSIFMEYMPGMYAQITHV